MLWLFLQGVNEGNSKVCTCREETTAGIPRDRGHNPAMIAATRKRGISVFLRLANGAQAFTSCL